MDDFTDGFEGSRYGQVFTSTPPSVHYINESGLPDDEVIQGVRRSRQVGQELANLVEQWQQSLTQRERSGTADMFGRKQWNGAGHIFATFGKLAHAVKHDDILSTLADVTEALSYKKCRFEMTNEDQQDIWDQWAREVDLDSRLRELHREMYKFSQVNVGLWWETRTYTVRSSPVGEARRMLSDEPARGGNRRRRKTITMRVPTAMTVFDPTKVLPVGTLMFGREQFAYCASRAEHEAFLDVEAGQSIDPTVARLLQGRWRPSVAEVHLCQELGVDPDRLWLFRPGALFRHCATRASYERFAEPRLEPALELIAMKQALRGSDYSSLQANANFIIVITKGTDTLPAKPAEIENLKEQSRVVARMPVLVGDHRLHVEIVSPPLENTMMETRWQVLDSRLVFKALRSFAPIVVTSSANGTGVSEMSRVVSEGLENSRHQLVRALERHIFTPVMDGSDDLDEFPTLAFLPKHITLDFKADIMNAILKLRDRGDISRETTLDELDFDQDVEVRRRARERKDYDPIFQSGTPYGSPSMNPYGTDPQQPAAPDAKQDAPGVKPGSTPEGGRPPGVTETKRRQAKDAGPRA